MNKLKPLVSAIGATLGLVLPGIVMFVGVLGPILGLGIILAFPVKWLWNSSVTELFGFQAIDVWMAWKLSFLSGLLFNSTSRSSKPSKTERD